MYFNKGLTDKELLMDLMNSEKQLSYEYNNAILESFCPDLRRVLFSCLLDTQDIHFSILNAIESRGWNTISPVHQRDIDRVTNNFKTPI